MTVAYTIGRIFLPILFLVNGIQKVINVGDMAKLLEASGIVIPQQIVPYLEMVPYFGSMPKYELLGYLIAVIEIACGLMVLIGLKARWAALMLIVFTACTIIFVHHFWDMEGAALIEARTEALKNLSIMGGLLLVVAMGSGPNPAATR
jgi:putative oxidoreductase